MQTTPEKHLLLAANALYLNRLNFQLRPRSPDPDLKQAEFIIDQEDYSSYRRLKDFISFPGLMDDRIEPPFQGHESLAQWRERLAGLIVSDADISRVTFKDVPFSEAETGILASANSGELGNLDLMMPICRWWPGGVIWAARDIVINRLKGGASQAQPQALKIGAGVPWQEVAARCGQWNAKAPQGPFIREVVGVVIADHLSAKAAAERVVSQRGHSTKGRNYKSGTVVGATFENAVENLSRPARNILKFLEKNGAYPI